MSLLYAIVAEGNQPPMRPPYGPKRHDNWVHCADGFKVSVLAGEGAYCSPRPSDSSILGQVPADYPGPYTEVEVGFPSERPEPWDDWSTYCENDDDPTGTVYAYVPVDMVQALIESHGGEK